MDEPTGSRPGSPPPRPDEPDGGIEPEPSRTQGLVFETCYRHPRVQTGVHCTRCGRPICTDCMHPAAVGYQCPECLRQAARTAPRRRTSLRFLIGRPGSLTTTLLVTNVGMYVLAVVLSGGGSLFTGPREQVLFDLGAMYPPAIADGQYWRLFSAMFLHANLIHILFNMYALYMFGYLIEGAFGKARFIAIYFVTGFLASVASYTFSSAESLGVGASGAIFGLLGAWVAFNYRRRQSAMAAAQLRWALMLVAINLILGFSVANIDNFAHMGGLVAGAAAGWLTEGFGPRATRTVVSVGGLVVLMILGIVLTAYRTSALLALLPGPA
jgi:membrane associated rhomboid family serine protease